MPVPTTFSHQFEKHQDDTSGNVVQLFPQGADQRPQHRPMVAALPEEIIAFLRATRTDPAR